MQLTAFESKLSLALLHLYAALTMPEGWMINSSNQHICCFYNPPHVSSLAPSQILSNFILYLKNLKIPTKALESKHARGDDDESSSEDGDNAERSYENIVGAYNPKDYSSLTVTSEVKDLFQYIERFKPQEVQLESTLKCFIPEYIPAIGEMDAFIKVRILKIIFVSFHCISLFAFSMPYIFFGNVFLLLSFYFSVCSTVYRLFQVPRPDKKDEDLGLKFLDEPCGSQSDPTVLELQLRAMSKKLQYGDVVVRSIENAGKNPAAIDKWIVSVSDLHRSKPPPQVHYKKNMPDIDSLLDVWPEEFEQALKTLKLPSPDLDLSLLEYSKTLCSILDIPVYENPVESLHQMFSLYMDFRNNPHLQAREVVDREPGGGYADVMHVDQGEY